MPQFSLLALDGASTGLAVARAHNFDLPDTLLTAEATVRELRRIASTPAPPPPTLPATVDKIAATLAEAADAQTRHAATRALAEDYTGPAVGEMVGLYRAALPGWLDALAGKFDEALSQFTSAAPRAPLELHGYADDAAVAAYLALQRAGAVLDTLAQHRAAVGATTAEEGAAATSVYLVATPPQPPTDPAVFENQWRTLTEWSRSYASLDPGVDRWRQLLASGWQVGLARHGEVAARIGVRDRWAALNATLHSYGGGAAFRAAQGGAPTPQRAPSGRVVVAR